MKPLHDLGVLDLVPLHAMFEGQDGEPTREEIEKALKGLRVSGPGDSVVPAQPSGSCCCSTRSV
jgi:hypothetical protein